MDLSLDDLKKAFENKSQPGNSANTPGHWTRRYDFWRMNEGEQAVVRFLPDKNPDNPLGFLLENTFHKLQVNGKTKVVPCLSMFGKACPCCALSQDYYNQGNEELGRKYWKKREYLANILVINSPFDIENAQESKYVSMSPKLFRIINEAFKNDDLEAKPYLYEGGYNFRFKKTRQGDWANYDLSNFIFKQTDLTEEELDGVDLFDLSELRTQEIDRELMETYILADKTGQSVEDIKSTTASTPQQTAPAASRVDDEVKQEPVEAKQEVSESASDTSDKLNDVLSQLNKLKG